MTSLEALEAGSWGEGVADVTASDPAQVLDLKAAQRAMWCLLQQVSPGARDALILRYYEELPYAEIAELLGCSCEAARARVAHGKVQLRRLLAGAEERRVCVKPVLRSSEAG